MDRGTIDGESGVELCMHCFGKGSSRILSVLVSEVTGAELESRNKTKALGRSRDKSHLAP